MEALPSAAFLFGILFIPESPRFLFAEGQAQTSAPNIRRIGGDAEKLVQQVEQSLKGEHQPRPVGPDYSRYEAYCLGGLGGNGAGGLPAIRRYQRHFLLR